MTVSTTTIKSPYYDGDGVTTQFAFNFNVTSEEEVSVYVIQNSVSSKLSLGSDYTVSFDTEEEDGTVTLSSGSLLPSGSQLLIVRETPLSQPTSFVSLGRFAPEMHERQLDRFAQVAQEIDAQKGYTLTFSMFEEPLAEAPKLSERAGKVLAFDNDGNPSVASVNIGDSLMTLGDLQVLIKNEAYGYSWDGITEASQASSLNVGDSFIIKGGLPYEVVSSNPDNAYTQSENGFLKPVFDPIKDKKNIDVFVVYGQSNAAGGGSNSIGGAFECPAGWGLMWDWATSSVSDIQDPTGKISTVPSAWPSFAQKWALLTGRKALIVNAAVGGSTIYQLSSDSGSARWTDMIAAYKNAITDAEAQGYNVNSIQMIWSQGEADATNLTDLANYESKQSQIESEFRTDVQSNYTSSLYRGMWLSLLGFAWADTDITHHRHTIQIQLIQTSSVRSVSQIRPIWDGSLYYTQRNNLMQSDGVHYSQIGYDKMGREIAENIYNSEEYGLDIKGSIIEKMLRFAHLDHVASTQLVGSATDFPALSKIKDYDIEETIIEYYADRAEILNGVLKGLPVVKGKPTVVNNAGFGLKIQGSGEAITIENEDGTFTLNMAPSGITVKAGATTVMTVTDAGRIRFQQLQNGSAGLASGDIYYDSTDANTVKYVP